MSAVTETPAPAGWYDDPGNPGIARWWDGAAWTEARRPVPSSSPQPDVTTGVFNGLVLFVSFAILIGVLLVMLYYAGGG